jgi:hypothetical protein
MIQDGPTVGKRGARAWGTGLPAVESSAMKLLQQFGESMLAWTIILVIGVVRGFATGANMPVDRLRWQPIDRPFPAHGSASL